jgi:hypothetical protein
MATAGAGYSGTPLLQKLGIQEKADDSDGQKIAFLNAPKQLPGPLAALAATRAVRKTLTGGPFDVILLFTGERATLAKQFAPAARNLKPAGGLWIAWPKKASGVPTDVTEDRVREIALAAGLVDNKVCAIDETWSGLRCVHRLKDRPR